MARGWKGVVLGRLVGEEVSWASCVDVNVRLDMVFVEYGMFW